jgi:hypothetical protein
VFVGFVELLFAPAGPAELGGKVPGLLCMAATFPVAVFAPAAEPGTSGTTPAACAVPAARPITAHKNRSLDIEFSLFRGCRTEALPGRWRRPCRDQAVDEGELEMRSI